MGQSLSQDATDRYTHRWAFATLLLLAIITLLLPLSPSLTFNQQGRGRQAIPNSGHKTLPGDTNVDYPEYKASCWCPPEFTGPMVVYTNALCSSALNALSRGRSFSEASLFETMDGSIPPDPAIRQGEIKPFTTILQTPDGKESTKSSENLSSGIQELIGFKAPLYLFLLALCLRLPRALQSLVSTCCVPFNVEQTLRAIQASQSMDSLSRERFRDELTMCLSKLAKKSNALLYLLIKLLMVVVLCLEVAVVSHGLLGETHKLDKELDTVQAMENEVPLLSRQLDIQRGKTSTTSAASAGSYPDFTDDVLLCGFGIRHIQNLQTWSIQCVFTSDRAHRRSDGAATPEKKGGNKEMEKNKSGLVSDQFQQEKRVVLLYKALFTSVLALLVVLLLCTIVSFLTWLVKLFFPGCRPAMGLPSDVCMDVAFMISMAWANASPSVAIEIARLGSSIPRSHTDGKEEGMSFPE